MDGPHEASISGVPANWSWGSHPSVDNVAPPPGFTSMTGWGQVYAQAGASEPAQGTVRVELKNMESYVWSRSQSKWLRVQATTQVDGGHFVENFAGNAAINCDWRAEPDGGISTALVTGYNVHFWPKGARPTLPIPASDIGGEYTTVQARLIGADVPGARYLLNVGGDWWQSPTAPYVADQSTNPGIGQGRFMYLNGNWQAYNFWTGGTYSTNPPGWTDARMTSSNPQLDGMGLP